MRSAAGHVVAGELALFLVVLTIGFLPLPVSVPSSNIAVSVAIACWTALLVPARRRWPAAALLGTAPVFAGDNIWALATLPVITFAAARRVTPVRRLRSIVPVVAGVDLLLLILVETRGSTGLGEALVGYAITAGLLLLLPASAAALVGQRQPLVRLLRERNEYLERAQVLTADNARMEERARIAGEMHDMLGHRLSLISMHAGALELATAEQAPRLSGQAELLRTTAGTALGELREILGLLRDTTDRASETVPENIGTQADITVLVTESRQAGIGVELAWSGSDLDNTDLRIRHAVHRVVREGLTNVHKHAPTARARVDVTNGPDRIQVSVINGPESSTRQRHPGTRHGLVGLEERITLLHGAFTAGPTPEGGFRVAADLPLDPALPTTTGPGLLPNGLEPPKPLDAEALTMPRALGAGCVGLLAIVPVVSSIVILIIMLAIE